jgi:hypothetical protein
LGARRGTTPPCWLSGEPIDEPIVGQGPFVMNPRTETEQAIDDFNSGRFGRIKPAERAAQDARVAS